MLIKTGENRGDDFFQVIRTEYPNVAFGRLQNETAHSSFRSGSGGGGLAPVERPARNASSSPRSSPPSHSGEMHFCISFVMRKKFRSVRRRPALKGIKYAPEKGGGAHRCNCWIGQRFIEYFNARNIDTAIILWGLGRETFTVRNFVFLKGGIGVL